MHEAAYLAFCQLAGECVSDAARFFDAIAQRYDRVYARSSGRAREPA